MAKKAIRSKSSIFTAKHALVFVAGAGAAKILAWLLAVLGTASAFMGSK